MRASASNVVGNGTVVLVADSGAIVSQGGLWAYMPSGNVAGVSPSSGQMGTRVTITGTGLRGWGNHVVNVTLAGVSAQNISTEADTQVIVVAGYSSSSSSSPQNVVLTSDSGAVVTGLGLWSYLTQGSVTSVSPSVGQEGTVVTIVGSGLLGGGANAVSVTLSGVAAGLVSCSNTTCIVNALANNIGAGLGDVVIVSNTGAVVTGTGAFTYSTVGTISLVTPSQGQWGTLVSITGQRLLGGGSNLTSVQLSGVAVSTIISVSDTLIVVRAGPASLLGVGAVSLVSNSGAVVVQTGGWSYVTASVITSVSPHSGQIGTIVTIQGTNLLDVSGGTNIVGITAR